MNLSDFGYIRVAACAPPVALADPARNADQILLAYQHAASQGASLLLLPELSLCGFSCEDLLLSEQLLADCRAALSRLVQATAGRNTVLVVGGPWLLADARLLNCAFVCAGGRLLGAVPKIHLPNHGEFYDKRWFVSGQDLVLTVTDETFGQFFLGPGQLFQLGPLRFGIEICEDLWSPAPPGAALALAGAELILNPSASNELVAKADYRRDLVRMTSAQRICAYLYASAGPSESSKDLVFGGQLLLAENGQMLAESSRFDLGGSTLSGDIDWQLLRHDRRRNQTFASSPRPAAYPVQDTGVQPTALVSLQRKVPRHPFVPQDKAQVAARAAEIMQIQATGLARRMQSIGAPKLVIGLSGGLDSTLAYLVCLDALAILKLERNTHLVPLTMPGPGTSAGTLEAVRKLCQATASPLLEIPIAAALAQHLADLGQAPAQLDLVFENAQARERTQLLFNYANKVGGLVVGTGDLSELALGWCTFNGDQMASYNVNASVPKTLISYLVRWYAQQRSDAALAAVLADILATPISPELLPPDASGAISQATESIIGPYELHDFFLYGLMRHGFAPAKIFALAQISFAGSYDAAEIRQWLALFLRRFFSQQFKRTTLPPGPKVGSVSLSPRGDWRMPDEASARAWLAGLEPTGS